MALQFDTTTRNNWATQLVTDTSAGTLKFWSGTEPPNCGSADPGTGLLCTITLPNPALALSGGGTVVIQGSWTANAAASGIATFFRIYNSGSACVMQGNVTTDLVLNNTTLTSGQPVTVTQFTMVMPGA